MLDLSVSASMARFVCAIVIGLIAISSGARADSLTDTLLDGAQPLADIRARFEGVDDKSKTTYGDAYTVRARLGVQTGVWDGLSALIEMDAIWDIDSQFNSTRNGKTSFPTIADPEMVALNRLQLSYASDYNTNIVVGRQRILIGDQRFIGNAGWRQHEQTFDAATLTNTSVPGLTVTYSYVDRVNRVYGPSAPVPTTGAAGAFHCDCHILDLAYSGVPNLKLDAFGILLDISQRSGPAATQLATTRLSTATFGADGSYNLVLDEDFSTQLLGEYAHQNAYRNNPLSIDLDYWHGEAGLTYAKLLTATVGYEALRGNGTIGFSTPLATIHLFDGWADMFLTTPTAGLSDVYVQGTAIMPFAAAALDIDTVKATIVYRDFSTDPTNGTSSIGIGTEGDAALEFDYKNMALLLQYADYHGAGIGSGGFSSKSITWVQAAYKY